MLLRTQNWSLKAQIKPLQFNYLLQQNRSSSAQFKQN